MPFISLVDNYINARVCLTNNNSDS